MSRLLPGLRHGILSTWSLCGTLLRTRLLILPAGCANIVILSQINIWPWRRFILTFGYFPNWAGAMDEAVRVSESEGCTTSLFRQGMGLKKHPFTHAIMEQQRYHLENCKFIAASSSANTTMSFGWVPGQIFSWTHGALTGIS